MKYTIFATLLISAFFITILSKGTIAQVNNNSQSQQQGSFQLSSPTPVPTIPLATSTPKPVNTVPPNSTPLPATSGLPMITGGAQDPNSPYFCIDDEDPEPCDDNTAFLVPKGSGGVSGTCGTVIEWAIKIAQALPQDFKVMRDKLPTAISSPCGNTGTYSSGYISTFFVIDSYNLAGFPQLSKSNASHVVGTSLLNWWKTTAPFTYIDYGAPSGSHQAILSQNLVGKTMFINLPSGGVHVGIVNSVNVDSHGNGIISILQAGTQYWLDRFEIVNWSVTNTPLHQTNISGVAGFGGH